MQASPSKARAQALEAHAWSMVLSWLSSVFHPLPVPSFERRPTTLKALQSLRAESITAERVRELLFLAGIEELAADKSRGHPDALLQLLEFSLPVISQTSLESLARSTVLLGCITSPIAASNALDSLQSHILTLSRQILALESQVSSTEALTLSLSNQIIQTKEALAALPKSSQPSDSNSPPGSPSPSSPAEDYSSLRSQTLQYQRETKQLTVKSAEYKDHISALEREAAARASSGPALDDFAKKQETVNRKNKKLEALEKEILVFCGLPPNLEASRAEVRRSQAELEALEKKRDELFESMGR